MASPLPTLPLRVMRRILQLLRSSVPGDRTGSTRVVSWRWLVIAGLLLGTLPAHAIVYTFPSNLPVGCVDNSGGNYSCPGMTLAASDRFIIDEPKPVTITFSGAVTTGSFVELNASGAASDLILIVNGAFVLGANSALNGSVQTLGAGAVSIGAGCAIVGNISTQTGFVTVGAYSTLGGSVSTVTGYVTLGAGANISGTISTQDQGYVVLGAGGQVGGSIVVSGGGYVTTGDSAAVGGSVSTVNGGITVGAKGLVGGDISVSETGGVTLGAGSNAVGNISTQDGSITVGANGRVDGQISVNGTGDIALAEGSRAYAVCCKSTNTSCVANRSGDSQPQTCVTASAANFDCMETGALYNNLVGNPVLRNPLFTKLVGISFTFDIAAIRANGAQATTYASGSSRRTVQLEVVDGSGSTACASRTAVASATSQLLVFVGSDGGRKTATLNVTRAYSNLRCRITDATVSPSVVGCSSDSFSVRPVAPTFAVSAAPAPSARALPVIVAGTSFDLGATAQPDSGYGGTLKLDTSKLTAQIPAQDTTVQGGGVLGALMPVTLVANAAPAAASYTEVGYLYLAPGTFRDDLHTLVDSTQGDCITDTTDNLYLADTLVNGKYGCSVGNRVPLSLGRFIPNHFDVDLPTLTASCAVGTPFSYFGQDGFTTAFTMTARNFGGTTTQNYSGAFARFDLSNYTEYLFSAAPLPAGSALASGATSPVGTWGQGVARVSVRHQVSRPTAPMPDTVVAISAKPSDGEAGANAVTLVGDSVRLRYGRLQMKNAYGSEMLALPVPLEAQYWTMGGYYATNTDDSCTVIPPASIVFGNYQKQLAACETQLSAAGGTTLQSGKLAGGGLVLSPPGAGNAGSVDLQLNLTTSASGNTCLSPAPSAALAGRMPWFGASPIVRATFGIYKSRLIYSRENY